VAVPATSSPLTTAGDRSSATYPKVTCYSTRQRRGGRRLYNVSYGISALRPTDH
jgi:hypothetical protein